MAKQKGSALVSERTRRALGRPPTTPDQFVARGVHQRRMNEYHNTIEHAFEGLQPDQERLKKLRQQAANEGYASIQSARGKARMTTKRRYR